jgi:hypothetical protein
MRRITPQPYWVQGTAGYVQPSDDVPTIINTRKLSAEVQIGSRKRMCEAERGPELSRRSSVAGCDVALCIAAMLHGHSQSRAQTSLVPSSLDRVSP